MAKRLILTLLACFSIAIVMNSCKASKGCGCKTNLNHYNPKKGR